jgi:hypothetical protein
MTNMKLLVKMINKSIKKIMNTKMNTFKMISIMIRKEMIIYRINFNIKKDFKIKII